MNTGTGLARRTLLALAVTLALRPWSAFAHGGGGGEGGEGGGGEGGEGEGEGGGGGGSGGGGSGGSGSGGSGSGGSGGSGSGGSGSSGSGSSGSGSSASSSAAGADAGAVTPGGYGSSVKGQDGTAGSSGAAGGGGGSGGVTGSTGGSGGSRPAQSEQDAARDIVKRGGAVPFAAVIPVVRAVAPGKILDVKLVPNQTGGWNYWVLVLQADGRYQDVRVDGKRNRVIEIRRR